MGCAVIAEEAIAQRYGLPVISEQQTSEYNFWLKRINGALSLCQNHDSSLKPFGLDFGQGKLAYRLKQTHSQREPLARACGFTKGRIPEVADATAGLGQDGMLLAAMGAEVCLVEQHPLVHALLDDALQRAASGPDWLVRITNRISLQFSDSIDWLQSNSTEVVYLDPMYPTQGHQRSAKVKKGMQLLRLLPGTITDHEQLFYAAHASCNQRLVVKRPNWATTLAGVPATSSYATKTHHYDIYTKN